MNLIGASAIVSGGASGLGEAVVRRLSADGVHVVIADRNIERASTLARELGAHVHAVETDVTSAADVQRCVDTALAHGPLRVAVNCAGIGTASRTLGRDNEPHDLDLFKRIIEINLIGSFNVLRLAASAMAKQDVVEGGADRGVIISTASVAAFEGQIGQAAYSASKGGIAGMTLPIARDLSRNGIRVVTIAPGLFHTPLFDGIAEAARQSLETQVPHPARLGRPDEYADLVRFIISNDYMNGEVIRLDGAIRMGMR